MSNSRRFNSTEIASLDQSSTVRPNTITKVIYPVVVEEGEAIVRLECLPPGVTICKYGQTGDVFEKSTNVDKERG